MSKRTGVFFLVMIFLLLGCREGEDISDQTITIELSGFPRTIAADGVDESTIWASIKFGGEPCPDSTVVQFACTGGSIEPTIVTMNGLAATVIVSDTLPGPVWVVGIVQLVSDSIQINFGVDG